VAPDDNGWMSAPSRRRDPFRPPLHEEKPLELASGPPPPAAPAVTQLPASPRSTPAARGPVRYRKPGSSWVTVVVLAFAGVGVAAVGGGLLKKLTGLATVPTPAVRPAASPIYRELAKDDAVLIQIAVTPREARLMLDGEPLASNPVRVARGSKPHMLAATADGYAPTVEEFTADKSKTVHLRLPRARP
jgi:hypothetical protein